MKLRSASVPVVLIATLWLSAALAAQQAPQFEAVTIKPNTSGQTGGTSGFQPGGYVGINVTVRRVIGLAYLPVPGELIDGGPEWITREYFDIQAKFQGNPPRDQRQQMLQNMLSDRFRLRVHREMRPTRVFALTVARPGSTGPSLRRHDGSCGRADAASPDPGASRPAGCGGFRLTDGLLSGRGITLDRLASELGVAGRIVVNKTGLPGEYDVDLKWTDDNAAAGPDAPPTLVTALREQLGLKLEADTQPMEHLVIDSVERPTAN